jgi:hypothetical protein
MRSARCPVVPIVHRPRLLRPDGRSIFHDVIPIADAANKMATDMMVSGEFHAMPRRWAIGMSEEDFVDEHGKQMSTWESIAGRIWSTEKGPKEVQVGQFDEADLAVFHNTIKLLAHSPASFPGCRRTTWRSRRQPAVSRVRRAARCGLIKGAERIMTPFGGGWEAGGASLPALLEQGRELPP